MARKRYNEEDILRVLREIEVHLHGGMDVVSACRTAGISDKTYYGCLSPVKLCHNLIDRGDQNYGSKTVFGRRYFEATARG